MKERIEAQDAAVADAAHVGGGGPVHQRRVRAASWAVITVFFMCGFVFAAWMSRIPAVRDRLELTPSTIGLILLVGSIGSVVALPISGAIATRFGIVRTVFFATVVGCVGYLGIVGGYLVENPYLVAAGLVVACMGISTLDVGMNLEGALVEQGLGRSIMPIYHAGFSGGTVVGAALGALMSRLGVPVEVHIPAVLVAVVISVGIAVRFFLPDESSAPEASTPEDPATASQGRKASFAAWLEPRTLLIGLVVFSAALTEGAANDWLALASIDAFGLTNSDGALMLTVFLTAMTIMRFVGTALLDRFGRILILRLCIAFALVGLLIFGFAPGALLGGVGAVLWGLGAALGFPVGMSAASDDAKNAAARLSVVATIGYTAFLMGPALLGFLAEAFGSYRLALLCIAVPLLVSLFVVKSAAPLPAVADAPAEASTDTATLSDRTSN